MIDFATIFEKAWKRKAWIALLALVFYGGCAVLYWRAVPRYESMSKWISVSQDPSMSSLQKFSSMFGGGGISSQDDFTNYKDIIISSEFLKPLLKQKVLLMAAPDSSTLSDVLWKRFYAKSHKDDSLLLANDPELMNGMVGILKGWINFISRSPVYQLRITVWDPMLAQSFNSRIINRAIEYNANERLGLSKKKRRFLETQLESFQSALKSSEEKLLVFEIKNVSTQSPALQLEKSRLMREVQINAQLVAEFRTEYEMARAEEDKEAVQLSTIEKPSFSSGKTFPGKILFFGGGLFGSVILACMLVLLYELALLVAKEYHIRFPK